jgi:hypothetical protein
MIDRRISVAPMMDWTDSADSSSKNNSLQTHKNAASFLVALAGMGLRGALAHSLLTVEASLPNILGIKSFNAQYTGL